VLSLAIVLGLASSPSAETSGGLELRWNAPPTCPDRIALLDMIDRNLGPIDDDADRQTISVQGRLDRGESEGFVVRLEIDEGRGGLRELEGDSCQELSEAAALVIAMAIDPRLLERFEQEEAVPSSEPSEIEPEPEPEPRDPPPSLRLPDPLARSTAEPRDEPRRAALSFVGRFDGGVGGGPLPGVTAVAGLGLGIAGRGWRAELQGSYLAPRTGRSPTNPALGVRAQLWNLGLQGCGEPRVRSVSFPLCAGLLAGAVHAIGVGEQDPLRVATRWVALSVEPGVVWWARPRLGLAIRTRGHIALARPQLRSEPSGTIFQSSAVGGSLRIGLDLRLP